MSTTQERPPTPLRIALFTGSYNHIEDGVSRTLNRLVRFLLERGHDVRVFGPSVDNPPMDHVGTLVPIPSIPVPGRPEYRITLVGRRLPAAAEKKLRAFGPNVVHIATPDLLGRAALRWAKKAGVPPIATYHTHFPSYLDFYKLGVLEGLVWRYLRSFYNNCLEVDVPTPVLIEELKANGITTKLRLWPRGVSTDWFSPEKRSAAWRKDHGFSENDVVVLYLSRLVKEKGIDVFSAVLNRLQESSPSEKGNVRALVVGDGPEREAFQASLPEPVFTGHLSGNELATAYASSDVFLFPSETETFGSVTLEAMASGLPVVCADAAGSRSLVDDGVSGFLCPARDKEAFTTATGRLANDAQRRKRMGDDARRAALAYAWPQVLQQMEQFYHDTTTTL